MQALIGGAVVRVLTLPPRTSSKILDDIHMMFKADDRRPNSAIALAPLFEEVVNEALRVKLEHGSFTVFDVKWACAN